MGSAGQSGYGAAGVFLAARRVERVLAHVAPALLGAGPAALGDAGVGTISAIERLEVDEVRRVGVDVVVDGRPAASRPAADGTGRGAPVAAPAARGGTA